MRCLGRIFLSLLGVNSSVTGEETQWQVKKGETLKARTFLALVIAHMAQSSSSRSWSQQVDADL